MGCANRLCTSTRFGGLEPNRSTSFLVPISNNQIGIGVCVYVCMYTYVCMCVCVCVFFFWVCVSAGSLM
jgi:hypothetical protein